MSKPTNNIADYADFELMYPGRYIKGVEVKAAGRPVTLTIKRIEPRHELKGKKGDTSEFKPCLFFVETEKGAVLNRTNSETLASCFGRDPRNWIGKRVVPCTESVRAFGRVRDALRFDAALTRAANAKVAPAPQIGDPPLDDADAERASEIAKT